MRRWVVEHRLTPPMVKFAGSGPPRSCSNEGLDLIRRDLYKKWAMITVLLPFVETSDLNAT